MHQERLMEQPFMNRLSTRVIVVVGMAVLLVGGAMVSFSPPDVISIDSTTPELVRINYLAPKVVLAQTAPVNNKFLSLSCPWAVGPRVLGSQSGGSPPALTVADAVGSCSAPACPSSHPTLAANYCVPRGIDIPFTVVPTFGSTVQYPPTPPLYHQVVGGNPTFYIHTILGPNPSPYEGPPTTTGGGSNAGGNGAGGGGPAGGPGFGGATGTGGAGGGCSQHTYAGGQGAWCGGSCPSGQVCRITGNSATPCSCQDRDSFTNSAGNVVSDYPLFGVNTWGGPLHYGVYTSEGEPGGSTVDPPSDVGDGSGEPGGGTSENPVSDLSAPPEGMVLQFSDIPASFAGPGTGTYINGLYTPETWWFASVGVCVNVCR